MKTTVTISESQLKGLIAESVKRVLKEYDEPFPYSYSDAREREAWFQRACKADFPGQGDYKIERTWESTYYTLKAEQMEKEERRKKAEKEAAKLKRQQDAENKKKAVAEKRSKMSDAWVDAAMYSFAGDDFFKEDAARAIMDDPENAELAAELDRPTFGKKWYDGEMYWPVAVRVDDKIKKCTFEASDIRKIEKFKEYEYGRFDGMRYLFAESVGGSVELDDEQWHPLAIEVLVAANGTSKTVEIIDIAVGDNEDNLAVDERFTRVWLSQFFTNATAKNFRKIWAMERAKMAEPTE